MSQSLNIVYRRRTFVYHYWGYKYINLSAFRSLKKDPAKPKNIASTYNYNVDHIVSMFKKDIGRPLETLGRLIEALG